MIGEVFRSEWFRELLEDLSDEASFKARFEIDQENLNEIIMFGHYIYEGYQRLSKYRSYTIYLTDILHDSYQELHASAEIAMNYISLICHEMKKEDYRVYYINDKYVQTFFGTTSYIRCEIFIGEKDETKKETINKYALNEASKYPDYKQKTIYNNIVKELTERSKEL